MKKACLHLLLLLLLAAACHPDPELPPIDPVDPVYPTDTFQNTGHLRFNDLQVGQQSRYLFFHCTHYGDPANATQEYRPDTLVVAVTGQDAEGFIILELLTKGSASRHGATDVWDADTVYTYHLRVVQDSLHILKPANSGWYGGSRLFVSPAQSWPLTPVADPKTEFSSWQTTLFNNQGYRTAYVENFSLWNQNFDRLNILSDNRDMQTDGPGFLYAYSGPHGLVRWAYYSWWTSDGRGWDLLE